MAKKFKLQIVTPERLFYDGEAESVVVHTVSGEEGFMARHSWATKLLDVGEIYIKEADGKGYKIAAAAEGFIDVKNEVVIFTDAAEWPDEIDVERSRKRKEQAEQWLQSHTRSSDNDAEFMRYRISLNKALNRMVVAQGGSRRSKTL